MLSEAEIMQKVYRGTKLLSSDTCKEVYAMDFEWALSFMAMFIEEYAYRNNLKAVEVADTLKTAIHDMIQKEGEYRKRA